MNFLQALILGEFETHPDKKLTPGNVIILLKNTPYTDEEIIAEYEALLRAGRLVDSPINGVHHASLNPQTI